MNDVTELSKTDIEVLARLAALPLPEGRPDVIRGPLSAWVKDANELSYKMSQARYLDLIPAAIFSHDSF